MCSNNLDTARDNVIPLYMFSWDASPCLFFNNGTINQLQKSVGTKLCRSRELNNKRK